MERTSTQTAAATRHRTQAALLGSVLLTSLLAASIGSAHAAPQTASAATVAMVGSTSPTVNKDTNPYGIAVVPQSVGALVQGSVLVSNFNNAKGVAGTGATIVEIGPDGKQRLFAQVDPASVSNPSNAHRYCPGGIGLTTALAVFGRGYVVVGSLPTKDGSPATAKAGCLIVLDSMGHLLRTITKSDINGPWDMTAVDQGNTGALFVTNVLNGDVAHKQTVVNQGTVVRLTLSLPQPGQGIPAVTGNTIIADGFAEKSDPAALIFGPTGLGLGANGVLYVADTFENRIAAIPAAMTRTSSAYTGQDLTAGDALNGPLGLTIVGNGDIVTVNGNDGNLVETTPLGTQVLTATLNMAGSPAGAGALFGVAAAPNGGIYFDDSTENALNLVPSVGSVAQASARLVAQAGSGVSGTVGLRYNAQTGMVDVTVRATGLAANSMHPWHVHQGTSCGAMGPVIFPLPMLQADAQGTVMAKATLKTGSIPASGWYINIHAGPGQETSLACGVVTGM